MLQNPIVLNANVSGSRPDLYARHHYAREQLPYYIQLQATDTNGNGEYSVALVNVVNQYKPGRVTTTVTDLVVPAKGLAINIRKRAGNSAGSSRDFGYSWSLALSISPSMRRTTLPSRSTASADLLLPPQFFFFEGDVGAYA